MATIKNVWKTVSPSKKPTVNNNSPAPYNPDFAYSAYYMESLTSAFSRIAKYTQYDQMDQNGDIARALDIIAEHMAGNDIKTNMPCKIDYILGSEIDIDDGIVSTTKVALRQWIRTNLLQEETIFIARQVIKYGDCFYRKRNNFEKWQFIPQSNVIGIDVYNGEKLFYHIQETAKTKTPSYAGGYVSGISTTHSNAERVPASEIIHFSLGSSISDQLFGESILEKVYQDFKKLTLLEQSAIIYRLVRAPERRIFYIDVSNMNQVKQKSYVKQVRDEIRNSISPSINDSTSPDTAYNPESILEEIWIPVNGDKSSRVETLPAGTWDVPELDYFQKKVFRALRIPTSYMAGQLDSGAVYNDGKVGSAYIEEQTFAKMVKQLQNRGLRREYDKQFKEFCINLDLNIDIDIFDISMVEPINFEIYREMDILSARLALFKDAEDSDYISKKIAMKDYLGWSEEKIQENEALLKLERNIKTKKISAQQQIYDPAYVSNREAVSENGDKENDTDNSDK